MARSSLSTTQAGTPLILLVLLLLPFVSPFALGASPTASSASIGSVKNVPITAVKSATLDTNDSPQPPLQGVRRVLSNLLNPTAGRSGDRWKGGEYNATLPSRLLFRYATPLLDIAEQRELVEEDAFQRPQKIGMAVDRLASIYNTCRSKALGKIESQKVKNKGDASRKEKTTLLKAMLLHQRNTLIFTGVLRFINTAVQAFPALLLARLLRCIEDYDSATASKALWSAVWLVVVLSIKMITENAYFHNVVKCATEVRGALTGLVFDKSLKVPGESASLEKDSNNKTDLGAGGVLNLMQSDTSVIEFATIQLHTIWDGPMQIALYTTLLYRYLGPSVFWGIGVLLTIIPINALTLRILNKMRRFENEAKDARTKRTTEAISNMKLLKLQAWEQSFADDIASHRKEELSRKASRGVIRALNQAVSNAVPALVLVVTLTAYAKTGRPIVASTIFTAISLFNQLRFPLFFYPMLIDSLANGNMSLNRLSSYLSAEEIVPYVETMPASPADGGSMEMKKGNFCWSSTVDGNQDKVAPALCDVELDIKPGEIVAVIGSVGSGKSALIKGLLGELSPVPRAVVAGGSIPEKEHDFMSSLDRPKVQSRGNIAYCSQEAWLPQGTLRDAIVFGREYNEVRYTKALFDAGLAADIVDTPGLDSKEAASRGVLSHDTNVGEGGSSLSGGQRARVALARALYAAEDTKVFLLDDPLAALDTAVGATVFDRLTRRLRESKAAAVLVTNDPNIPRRCDKVVLMGKFDGQSSASSCSTILDVGSYDELLARGHDLQSLSGEEIEEDDDAGDVEVTPTTGHVHGSPTLLVQGGSNTTEQLIEVTVDTRSNHSMHNTEHADPDCVECLKNSNEYDSEKLIAITPDEGQVSVKSSRKEHEVDVERVLTTQQEPVKKLASTDDAMMKGAVPFSAYVTYLKSVGNPLLIVSMIAAYASANGAQFFQQFIVSKWTELGKGDAISAALGAKYLNSLVYAAGVVSVFLWLRSFLTMKVGIQASKFLHSKMLNSVFKAPMSFFDSTPSGQLLSRFGQEMDTVDNSLPDGIGSVLFCFLQIFLSGAALAGVITPAMLLPLSVIGVLYVKTMGRFRPAARDLKRSESRSRSPVYTHFGEALRGKEIIRSIPHATQGWSLQHQGLTEQNLSVYYTVKALDRWLSIRLESLGNVVVFTSAVVSVFLTRSSQLKAGSAAWGMTQALSITGLLTWAVRTLTDLETNMMSMMRVQELTDLESVKTTGLFGKKLPDNSSVLKAKMPTEQQKVGEALSLYFQNPPNATLAPTSDAALIQSGWPWKGNIVFDNVSMRYNEISPLVLKDVSVTVPPGTTLGVVGRTGSGKSSLLLTLFRLVELERGGSIKIDGVDIRSVSLQTLRESLSIIPQDPTLFAGSLMYNLDATGKATKENAWAALRAASPELAAQFRNSDTGLQSHIGEGGANLSRGQRQLICLARALLRNSRILVMDEATSAIDAQTDSQVQETIRREFVQRGVTVITVAHRLETVLGYDKICVLGDGELLEYGTPSQLLMNRQGELRRLVEADRQNRRKGGQSAAMKEVVDQAAEAMNI